ncbi:MAG: aminoglycoside phosphotransferase (APT) family kinase protein [Cellvibrionaceae bacterium]|jgi:aminoglycoside phosphotransferase (APT) family kinase protein
MPHSTVIQRYFPQSEIIRLSRPKGGISADLTIVELIQNNRHYKIVIRQIPQAAQEYKLLKILQSAGVASPIPLFLDESCELLPAPFLILTYISGETRYRFSNKVQAGEKIGAQLARIHAIKTTGFDLSFLPTDSTHLPESSGHPAERPILDILEPLWPLPQTDSPVLLHGDFWPGNMLWQDADLVGVIDWEDAKVGNRLQDLAISRFDTLFIFGRQAMQALTESYFENSSIDRHQLPYWDLFAALRAAPGIPQWAAGWPELGRPDLTKAAIWKSLSWFIQQAKAKINTIGEVPDTN